MIAAAAHDAVLAAGIGWLIALLGVAVILVARSGTYAERVLRLDLVAVLLIAILVLLAAREGHAFYLDAALGLGLLSFVATLAASRAVRTDHGERG